MSESSTLAKLYQQFYLRTRRERALIIAAGLVLILMGGFAGVIEPIHMETQQLARAEKAFQTEMVNLNAELASLQDVLKVDPDAQTKQQMTQTRERIQSIDDMLARQTVDLVPADRMPTLLENVLAEAANVSLIGMQSIAPEALITSEQNGANEHQGDTGLYQHGVRLELEGRYFDIQRYLQSIEALPWRFYWKLFKYEVGEYPMAKVQIELYTLSTNEAFIGVARAQ